MEHWSCKFESFSRIWAQKLDYLKFTLNLCCWLYKCSIVQLTSYSCAKPRLVSTWSFITWVDQFSTLTDFCSSTTTRDIISGEQTTFDFPIGRHYNVSGDPCKISPMTFFTISQHIYQSLTYMLWEIREKNIPRFPEKCNKSLISAQSSDWFWNVMLVRSAE